MCAQDDSGAARWVVRCALMGLAIFTIGARSIPSPLADHPGNIFVAGESISVSVPAEGSGAWQLVDYEKKDIAHGDIPADHRVALGKLPVGYYELKPTNSQRVTIGVISKLDAPTPEDSPISIDVAMGWFYKTEPQQRAVANICTLAGINWVRDRMSWGEIEPQKGEFSQHCIYDDTARIQSEAGLKVLQVNHIPPPWDASPDGRPRFPSDLSDVYRFYRECAARWKGKVLAIEPWNEADIPVFGGQLGCEMAALQKAAYLGLKEGNPQIIACENVFAVANENILADFDANEAPFDTYNLHHYVNLQKYPAFYAAHRAVSRGQPMWVTECNMPVKWGGDPKLREPTDEMLRAQSLRVAKIFASSLYQGSVNTFYFMLPDYVERQTQYGVLHQDLTPRPAFVALAAVGKLLAGAKPIGQLQPDDNDITAYLFHTPKQIVLVAWTAAGDKKKLRLDVPVESVLDHLGRASNGSWAGELSIGNAPVFATMPIDPAGKLKVTPPPPAPACQPHPALPMVLQAQLPRDDPARKQSAISLPDVGAKTIKIIAYNFFNSPAKGNVAATTTEKWGWLIRPEHLDVPAMGKQELELVVDSHGRWTDSIATVRISADFQNMSDKAILSLRFMRPPPATTRSSK